MVHAGADFDVTHRRSQPSLSQLNELGSHCGRYSLDGTVLGTAHVVHEKSQTRRFSTDVSVLELTTDKRGDMIMSVTIVAFY